MNPFVEMVTFKSKPDFTPDAVIAAAEGVNVFLKEQPGFISRTLGRAEDGTWHDILFWESQNHLTNAMQAAATCPHCAALFGVIDAGHDKMALFPSQLAFSR